MSLSLKVLPRECMQIYFTKSGLLGTSAFNYRFCQRIPTLLLSKKCDMSTKVNNIMNKVNKNLELLNRSKDWKSIKNESQKLQNKLQVYLF